MPDIVAGFAVSVGAHPFALRSAAIVLLVLLCLLCAVALLCAVVLLCLLHGCAGVSTSLNSVATSFEASCDRLPCGFPSTECFVWSLHAPFLSLSSQARLSSARGLQHWTWRLRCCSAGTGHRHVLDLTVDLAWHLLDHLHLSLRLCILHHVLITTFRERNLLCFINFMQCLCAAVF